MSTFRGARSLIIFVTVLFGARLVIFVVFVFLVIIFLLFFVAELEAIVILKLLEGLDSRGEPDRLEALLKGLCTNVSILLVGNAQ